MATENHGDSHNGLAHDLEALEEVRQQKWSFRKRRLAREATAPFIQSLLGHLITHHDVRPVAPLRNPNLSHRPLNHEDLRKMPKRLKRASKGKGAWREADIPRLLAQHKSLHEGQ